MNQKIKIAIAGVGAIGLAHIKAIRSSRESVLSAIIDPSPGAVAVASSEGVPLYQ